MAARFKPKGYTFGAAAATIKDILASPNDDYVSNLVIRAKWSNAGRVFWGDGVEQGGYLDPGEAASFDLAGKFVATQEITLSGTQGDSIYLTVVS